MLFWCPAGSSDCVESGFGTVVAKVVRRDELPIQETGTVPGNLPYRTGVTKGGDAYVDIPVAVAPGVNGLQPRLSIDYGGGRERELVEQELASDILGYGWHLSVACPPSGGASRAGRTRTESIWTRRTGCVSTGSLWCS